MKATTEVRAMKSDRPRDGKRSPRAKAATITLRQQRNAKRAIQGR